MTRIRYLQWPSPEAERAGAFRGKILHQADEGLQVPNVDLLTELLKIQRGPFDRQVRSTLQDVLQGAIGELVIHREFDNRLVQGITERLGQLEQAIKELADELKSRPVASVATLYDLGTDEATLAQPVQIAIEQYDEEVIASWPEIQAFGSGSSSSEAILALKRDIVELHSDLHSTPDGELGTLALAWKKTLEKVVALDGTAER